MPQGVPQGEEEEQGGQGRGCACEPGGRRARADRRGRGCHRGRRGSRAGRGGAVLVSLEAGAPEPIGRGGGARG